MLGSGPEPRRRREHPSLHSVTDASAGAYRVHPEPPLPRASVHGGSSVPHVQLRRRALRLTVGSTSAQLAAILQFLEPLAALLRDHVLRHRGHRHGKL